MREAASVSSTSEQHTGLTDRPERKLLNGRQRRRAEIHRVGLRIHCAPGPHNNPLKPWQKRTWYVLEVSGEFVARMEDVLEL
jgi:hypothetical protein